jgi:hypothetical protein
MFKARIRKYQPEDIPFVRDSFTIGAANSPDLIYLPHSITKPRLRTRFDHIVKVSEIWVAHHTEEDEPLYGWLAVTNLPSYSIVWWVYVKNGYRGLGFAELLASKITHQKKIVFPMSSQISKELAKKYDAVYDPFIYEELCLED